MGTEVARRAIQATHDAIKILDASGYEYIIIETVGVGQSEVDIVKQLIPLWSSLFWIR